MKLFNLKALALATAAASVLFVGTTEAQNTLTVPVTATVQNAITLTLVDPLSLATIIAINEAGNTATAVVNPLTDAVTYASGGGSALMAQASGSPTAAEFTMAGVTGATINVTLGGVVNPTDGTDVLAISAFQRSVNGAAAAATTAGTPFTVTATASDTIHIGATFTTPAQANQIGDGAYAGEFVITASY